VTGTILNALTIVLGGTLAAASKRSLPAGTQNWLKIVLGALMVFFGLRLTWMSLSGPFSQLLKQLGIVVLAMMLGKLTGSVLRLQKASNRLGRYATRLIESKALPRRNRLSDGFTTCSLLFCAAPLAMLGALQDGLSGYFAPLAIKAVIDGLAAAAFVQTFGWGVVLAALPVFAWQGTVSLAAMSAAPFLAQHHLIDAINATGGLLTFCVALVILELRKLELTNYLPSLLYAPLLTWLWR
jgi:uncharacterized membrane protein YqgA involved in biofilm formation